MMAPLLAIWRQPFLQMRSRSSIGLSSMLLVVSCLGLLTASSAGPKRGILFAIATGVPMCMLLGMWWIYLLGNVATQCHPAAVQLVPHLRRHILRAVVLAWLAIVAVMTLLAGVPTGHAAQVAIVTALALIEVGVMAGMLRGGAIAVALWAAGSAHADVTAWLAAWIHTPMALWCGALAVALDGAAAVRRLTRLKSPAPGKWALPGMRDTGQVPPRASRHVHGADAQPPFLRPLGRSWVGWHADTIALVVLPCVAARLWCAWHGQDAHSALALERVYPTSMMAAMLCYATITEARRFSQARHEQALLLLTPAAPARAVLNRVLGSTLLRGFLRSWAYLGIVSLLALGLAGADGNEVMRGAGSWTVMLALAASLLRDYAGVGEAPRWPGTLLVMGITVVCAVISYSDSTPGWWSGAVAATGLASALLTGWRWHRMIKAPPAFPAGRCA